MAMAGGREAEAEEGVECTTGKVRLGVLFCFLHLRAAGWDHPTLPVLGLLLVFFLALFSPHRNHAVEGRKERTTAPWWEKGATPSYPHAIQDQANRSRSFPSPVSLREADFSICSSKFASFNPSPSLVPLPSYDTRSLTLSAEHTASTRGERERPERDDSFVRWPSPFPREGDGLFQTV